MSEGEQEVIIYLGKKGKKLTLSKLQNLDLHPNIGDWKVSEKAIDLHQRGRAAGSQGDFELALKLLEEAEQEAPDWPYPPYDAGFTCLLFKDFPNALSHYRRADRLAPNGFFTTKTAIDVLEKEEAGQLPHGIYLLYMQIEWASTPEEKLNIAQLLTAKCPEFAPAWKELALLREDPVERMKCILRGLDADPDVETEGVLLVNQAILIHQRGEIQAAKGILAKLIWDNQASTLARASARQVLLSITGN